MEAAEYKPKINYDLNSLENIFGGQNRVAKILMVDRSQITRWHKGNSPDRDNIAKIYGLNFIMAKLLTYFRHTETALKWIEGINAHLGHKRPLDLIKSNRISEVSSAIDQMIAGSYA